MWRIREKLEDIYYYFKDGDGKFKFILQMILTIAMVVLFLGIPLGWYDTENKEVDNSVINTDVSFIDISEFEILKAEELYTKSNNLSVLKIDVLIKNAEIESEYAQDILKFVFNQFRNKAKNEGKELIAFEISAYVSKIEYYSGIEPSGKFYKHIDGNLFNAINVAETFLEDYKETNEEGNKEDYNVLLNAKINFDILTPRKDYIVKDGDDIEVLRLDLGPYYTESELNVIYKMNEYVSLFNSNESNNAIGFYVYFDLGVPYDTYKHKSLTKKYSKVYQNYTHLYGYRLPSIDREIIAEHYRVNYPNLWSELIVQRGY